MSEKLLTPTELELMNIIWDFESGGSVRDVIGKLPKERELAYTSVSTILRILEKKGVLSSVKKGKTHIYSPAIAKPDYEKTETGSLVKNLFGGSKVSMLKCLIEQDDLSDEELDELRKLIEKRTT